MREKIKMVSTESPHYYTTVKNKRNTPEKLEYWRYDPVARKKALYKETKIKS